MKSDLSTICTYVTDKITVDKLTVDNYISTENMLPNKCGVVKANSLPQVKQVTHYKKGDVLVSNIRPYFKKIWLATNEGGCSNDVLVMRARKDIETSFLYYVLSEDDFFEYSTVTGKGTKMPRGDKTAIMKYQVPIIALEEQRKIVGLLNKLDKKININKEINDNLQQQAQALFKLWFVEHSPFDSVEPKEWKNVNLEDITSLISRGIAPKYSDGSAQMVINQKCIRNHMIDLSLARAHTPKAINEKWLRFGDLLINSTGDGTLGRTAQVWFQPQNLTVDSHVTIVRPIKENLIFYIGLWGILHEREIESLHTGSTGQTELPRERVKALELLLPDDETLDRFNTLVAPMTDAIVSNQEESNRLAALRNVLLPKLMSGEIDVTDIQI